MNKESVKLTVSIFLLTLFLLIPLTTPAIFASDPVFPDIQTHWAKETILWGLDQEIVNGFTDGTFKPNAVITEAQFLAMLLRVYEPDLISQTSDKPWTAPYYSLAAEKNYPVSSEQSKKNEPILRQTAAELMAATQGVHYTGNQAIKYLLAHQLANGQNPKEKTVLSFKGELTLTRAEAVTLIKNVAEHGKRELANRPKEPSDPNLIPYIPMGDEGKLNLPYKVPATWTPPHIRSIATENYNKNKAILEKELGLLKGSYYNPYGGTQLEFAEIMVDPGGETYIAQITLYSWYGSKTTAHDLNKIPYVAREIFKFYLPEEYETLYQLIDDYYNGEDISDYINQPFKLDQRDIKIIKSPYSISIFLQAL